MKITQLPNGGEMREAHVHSFVCECGEKCDE